MKYMLESGRIIEATIEEYRGIDIPAQMEDDERQNVESIIENLLGKIGFVYGGDTGNDILGFIGEIDEDIDFDLTDLRYSGCGVDREPTPWVLLYDEKLTPDEHYMADRHLAPWFNAGDDCEARPFLGVTVCGFIAESITEQFKTKQ
jgi:hypothetical protein